MSDEFRRPSGRSAPERLSTLLGAVLELSPDERERWLDESSGGNSGLREQLREMLRAAQAHRTPAPETAFLPGSGPGPAAGSGGSRPASGGSGRGTGFEEPGDERLAIGQHVGRYQVLDLLGAGGMGRVYRALDASLGREVAIKALSEAFRGDSRSLRRFEREARVLATLSHPNIATIYGFERLNGSPYLVLERVEGETLAQRLARGPVPVEEALPIAVQIVAGLEEAHAKGVIHRDLKPSNVMLTPAGHVKLVDFGLAKTPQRDAEESVEPITEVGLVVGTARYMSPEQVTGNDVDTRTDVWAFGCVLYEMLTARPVFSGRSVSEVAASVLRDEPDWSALPAGVPRGVTRLIRRCLRRDPRNRLQHVGDARIELADLDVDADRSAGITAVRARRPLLWPMVAAVAMLAAAVLGTLYVLRPAEGGSVPPARLSLEIPASMRLAGDYSAPFAVSPDGSRLVVEATEGGTRRLYLRELRDPSVRRLAGSDGAWQPFFSPDGEWVAFFTDRKLMKVAVDSGTVIDVADVGGNPRGATWTGDGRIVISAPQTAGLQQVSERGGRPAALTTLDKSRDEYSHRWPDAIPGTPWILFTVGLEEATFDEGRIEAVSLATGERRPLIDGAGFARYLPDGRLLFVRGGRVYAVSLDVGRMAVSGTPEVLLDAIRYDWRNGGSHLAVSPAGVLVYSPGEPTTHDHFLSWIGTDGRFTRTVDTPRRFRDPRRSPDGQRVAAVVGTAAESDLWFVDANATLSRLSFGLSPYRPTWTPDGRGITVGARRNARWRLLTIPVDGGEPAVLLESANRLYPVAWFPDGSHLLFQESRPETGWDVYALPIDAAGRPAGAAKAYAASPAHEGNAAVSPDGRWVAYESDELDGVVQVYVRSWPDGAHKVRVSTGGARWPAWGSAGELYYWQTGENGLRLVHTRQAGGQLTVGPPEPVWKGEVAASVLRRAVITVPNARFDIDPSRGRFLVLERGADVAPPDLASPVVVFGLGGPR